MAETPERKVKRKVVETLKSMGAYYTMPVASGFGNVGVPDILVCYKGRFIGIECKANGGKPTKLQLANLQAIRDAGGQAFIIDEHNLFSLIQLMESQHEDQTTVDGA